MARDYHMPVSTFLASHTSRELSELWELEKLSPSDAIWRLEQHQPYPIEWGKHHVEAHERERQKTESERARQRDVLEARLNAFMARAGIKWEG